MFTVGMGLLLSCVSVFLRDIFHIYGIILTIWNYLTPVFYSIEILPKELKGLMDFNPMYQFLTATRTIVVYEQMPTLQTLGIVTLFGVGMLLFGAYVFRKKQDKFIYYI